MKLKKRQISHIPFNNPYLAKNTKSHLDMALKSRHPQGGGDFSVLVEDKISSLSGGGKVFLTSSCTQALEMATILLDLSPGDEVVMPSFTFTSAATALINFGVVPVFVDIQTLDLNINVKLIESAITSRTRAISVVNYAGNACAYIELQNLAKRYDLRIIEDNAHGFGGKSGRSRLGSFGDVSTLSFHGTKNVQCGEGGALVVNSPELVDRAHILQEKGTNRKAFIQGQVEKYQWFDKGGSYLLPEVLSAILLAQIEEFEFIQASRVSSWQHYSFHLTEKLIDRGWRLPFEQSENVAHMFQLLAPAGVRKAMQSHLTQNSIESTFHYQSLHSSVAGQKYGRAEGKFDVSEDASQNLIRLPLWVGMTEEKLERVTNSVLSFYT